MLVEKSAFEVDPSGEIAVTAEAPTRGRGRGRGRARGRGRGGGRGGHKQGKDYAVSHGLKRGSFRGTDDAAPAPEATSDLPDDAPAEGLYAVIQATVCRRNILAAIFKNRLPHSESFFNFIFSCLIVFRCSSIALLRHLQPKAV
jgi:hypothetical protein